MPFGSPTTQPRGYYWINAEHIATNAQISFSIEPDGPTYSESNDIAQDLVDTFAARSDLWTNVTAARQEVTTTPLTPTE